MMFGIGTDNATIAGPRPQLGTTPGTHISNQSVLGGDVDGCHKATGRAGEVGLGDKVWFHHFGSYAAAGYVPCQQLVQYLFSHEGILSSVD